MSTHVPASGEPFDPEDALGRLDAAVASMGPRGATAATVAQATRLLAILARRGRGRTTPCPRSPMPPARGSGGSRDPGRTSRRR